MTFLRQWTLRVAGVALTWLYTLYRAHPAVWRLMARNYRPWMGRFARLHAWMTCQFAWLEVPAYREFLQRSGWDFRWFRLDSYPATDKQNYVRAFPEEQRCRGGALEIVGSVVDESSGSSGQPFNWVRGRRELRSVHKNLAGFTTMVFPSRRRFVINAYSMGAWATGTNTGIAMSQVAMVKNTGPDLRKILDTLRHFGPGFDYVVTAYPPFLKHLRDLLDGEGFPWAQYRISGLVGGEGMTEALRDYLEERFVKVRSGYGASDLTIGMAGETDLTVWVRRRLRADAAFRAALLGAGEHRLPMVFQYNPLETYLETTADGELLCTINSTAVLTPKLRYNIGDECRLWSFPDVVAAVPAGVRGEAVRAWRADRMRLPLLFLFGRRDSTVSYMGANIYPQDVEYGLYTDNPRAHLLQGFNLELEEHDDLESRAVVNLQLREGAELSAAERDALAARCREGVVAHLAAVSRDFAESLAEDPSAGELRVRVHEFGTGPFTGSSMKIKNAYLVRGTVMSRTTDFSKAPAQGAAGAMFIGGTHYASPWTLLVLYRPWRRMLRQMTRMRGYRWHKTYYQWPLTLGTIVFFDDRDALLTFARSGEHRDLMCWLTDHGTKRAKAGFIRIYAADPHGYSNGAWRAEDDSMGHIPTFSPLAREAAGNVDGPPVHRAPRR